MPKATESNTTNRRAFLSAMAVAIPAVVTGAALTDHPASEAGQPEVPWHIVTRELLKANICQVDGNDEYALYTVRVPREALGPNPYLVGMVLDDEFGDDLADWIVARTQRTV